MKRCIAASLMVFAFVAVAQGGETVQGVAPSGDGPTSLRSLAILGTPAWWTDRQAGLVGGISGSVFGCLGGLVGTLAGLGKARRLVIALMWGMLAVGVGSLIAGVAAVSLGQPYAVYYPLLLLGVILSAVMGPQIPMVRRRYMQIELRKMDARDAGGAPV